MLTSYKVASMKERYHPLFSYFVHVMLSIGVDNNERRVEDFLLQVESFENPFAFRLVVTYELDNQGEVWWRAGYSKASLQNLWRNCATTLSRAIHVQY